MILADWSSEYSRSTLLTAQCSRRLTLDKSTSGDLRQRDLSESDQFLHSFILDSQTRRNRAGEQHSTPSMALNQRLNFGVGGNGIVGRKISVLGEGNQILGEGIIGWD